MARYSEEFKHSIITKMMPPQNQSVADIAKETGLSEQTLYKWRRQAREKGLAVPGGETNSERWSTNKLWDNANYFKTKLKEKGFLLGNSETPITPLCRTSKSMERCLPASQRRCCSRSRQTAKGTETERTREQKSTKRA